MCHYKLGKPNVSAGFWRGWWLIRLDGEVIYDQFHEGGVFGLGASEEACTNTASIVLNGLQIKAAVLPLNYKHAAGFPFKIFAE